VPDVVSVANGTLGLILAMDALGLEGEVIVPSFTFSATAHALYWARLRPRFVDILPDTFTLDPDSVDAAVRNETCAIMPVHVYGHPCEIDRLQAVASRRGLPLVYDAAHGFGATWNGRPVGGFGTAEILSFHATKILPVGEGGCVATHDPALANRVALARRFGDPGTEDTLFPGQNAKMQEFNAIVGLRALDAVDVHLRNRQEYAARLRSSLGSVPGIGFQAVRDGVRHCYQNFAIRVSERGFGLERDALFEALKADGVAGRRYFWPPVHAHKAYRNHAREPLPVTESVAAEVICLPFYSDMTGTMLDGIAEAVARIQRHAPEVKAALS
jgi:dTDP-4-amino-4,6-dideoxygalactose transaminase